ncbi:hypothetical protein KUDE01_008528 [Dissostichus eleginoides]|uniref:Uncharacterized protein n=1 Tax=Dissostichus eleginoides TaxID=100907 RepID=A0AAD9FM16_DISEL|nr:hypothetical protein KUDE01_008528 [Dissostichus eleginoides]
MEKSNTQDGAEQNTPVLSTDEPVVKEMPITTHKSLIHSKKMCCQRKIVSVEMFNLLRKHRMRTQHPHTQIQVEMKGSKEMIYQGGKGEPLDSSLMINLGLQHAIAQHMLMECFASINQVYLGKVNQ